MVSMMAIASGKTDFHYEIEETLFIQYKQRIADAPLAVASQDRRVSPELRVRVRLLNYCRSFSLGFRALKMILFKCLLLSTMRWLITVAVKCQAT